MFLRSIAVTVCIAMAGVAVGQDRGPVTNLPLPRFVSMKASEANLRRGPSLTHRIDWVLKRRDMPLEVVAEYGHWRQVRDRDGLGGWIHYSLISGVRTVVVDQDIMLRSRADPAATGVAEFHAGVVARVDECAPDWCRIMQDGHRGWVPKSVLWGVREGEVLK